MSTLTATPIPGLAAIRLEASGLPGTDGTIIRIDANGINPVRLLPGQAPVAGALIVTDYEAALTGPVSYGIDDARADTELGTVVPVLAVAGRPNQRVEPAAVTEYGESTDSPAVVTRILDRDDPIILSGPHWTPSGSMALWCATYADAKAARDTMTTGRAMMFRQADHAGMDKYLIVKGTAIAPAENGRWTVRLDYDETATPTDPLLAAAGWDLNAVRDAFPDLNALAVAFATLNDLTRGP